LSVPSFTTPISEPRLSPALLILAAGRGSRFGGSKQLAPVGPAGEPLPAYLIHDAARAGFGRVVFVTPEGEADKMAREFNRWAPDSLEIQAVDQPVPEGREKPLGTGDAVLRAMPLLADIPFTVANADDFYGPGALRALAAGLLEPEGDHHLLVTYELGRTLVLADEVTRAFCETSDGWLVGLREVFRVHAADTVFRGELADGQEVEALSSQPVSTNLWGFFPTFLPLLEDRWRRFQKTEPDPDEEFLLPEAVAVLVGEGRIRVKTLPTRERLFGLTHPGDLPAVRREITRLVASGAYPADLRSGTD